MLGPGKYDEECHQARVMTGADGVLLVIVGGVKGNGFSFQTTRPELLELLPEFLERLAASLREDSKRTVH